MPAVADSGHLMAVALQRMTWGSVVVCEWRVIEVMVRLLLMGVSGRTVIGFLKNETACCHKKIIIKLSRPAEIHGDESTTVCSPELLKDQLHGSSCPLFPTGLKSQLCGSVVPGARTGFASFWVLEQTSRTSTPNLLKSVCDASLLRGESVSTPPVSLH